MFAKIQVSSLLLVIAYVLSVAHQSITSNNTLVALLKTEIPLVASSIELYRRKQAILASNIARSHLEPNKQPTCSSHVPPEQTTSEWKDVRPTREMQMRHVLIDQATHLVGAHIHFVQLLSLRMNSIAGRKKHVDNDSFQVLATATNVGVLELRDPKTFDLLWAVHTHLESIQAIHFAAGTRNVLVIVTYQGTIVLYSLRVHLNGRLIVGDYYRQRQTEQPVCLLSANVDHSPREALGILTRGLHVTSIPSPLGYHMEFTQQHVIPSVFHSDVQVLLVQVHVDIYVVVGTADTISVYARNGTCIHHLPTQHPVRSMVVLAGGSFAVTMGTDIGLLNIPYWTDVPQVCAGSADQLVSLERDSRKTFVIYAGTDVGTVLRVHLHRSISRLSTRATCSIEQQVVVAPSSHLDTLSSGRRYDQTAGYGWFYISS